MAEIHSVGEHERLHYLDSIRGIAAFIVVISHCWQTNPEAFRDAHRGLTSALHSVPGLLLYFLDKWTEAGRSCVIMFFVLSGFVLAFSLLKKPAGFAGYVVKRLFRIYPAFLLVIVASYLLHLS